MRLDWRKTRYLAGMIAACFLGAALVYSQARPAAPAAAEKPLMAEEAFKNVQVLRGIPAKEFMETMGFFAASLSLNCSDCHGEESGSDWSKYAVDTPLKNTARRMVLMVNTLNKANFGNTRSVTCYTCHRSSTQPKVIPSLAAQYAEPPEEDPDEIEKVPGVRTTATPEQIVDKYIQAIGGAAAIGRLTSFTVKGTYEGFDSDFSQVPVDVYAKAPDMRTVVAHMKGGDITYSFDGKDAWAAGPSTLVPVPVMPVLGGSLEGARLDAHLAFPGQIKTQLTGWSGGFPAVSLDGKAVDVIEARMAGGSRVKLYFDKQTSLLVRQTRFTDTAVGTIATHVIYSDYRPVAGVKLPYQWQVTWVDGQYTVKATAIQPNVAIDAARFGKPAPPK